MLQHDHLFEWRTIYHNILLGLEIQHTLTAAAKTHARELLKPMDWKILPTHALLNSPEECARELL